MNHLQVAIEDTRLMEKHQILQNRYILKFEPNTVWMYCMSYMQVNTIKDKNTCVRTS